MSQLISYYNSGHIALSSAANLPYTTLILAFLFTNENEPLSLQIAGGMAASASPPQLTQHTIDAIATLQANNQKVMISFGGGQMSSAAYNGIVGSEAKLAQSIAAFIEKYNLDGIDIDYEDTSAFMGTARYNGVDFLVNLTKALREELPSPQYLITHAPQPPYLQVGSGMDGYVAIMEQAGDQIDWLNVQFYNNPPWSGNPSEIISSYHTYSQLKGLSPEKLMIGLPVTSHDAASGYMPVNEIVTDVMQPIQQDGVLGGMMNWQFSSDTNGTWGITIGDALQQDAIS
jgi:chitinase